MLIQDREVIITDKDNSRAYLTIEHNEDDEFEMEQFDELCDILEYIENVQTDEFMDLICEYAEEKYDAKIWSTATYTPNNEEIIDGALLYIHLGFSE